MEEREDEGGHKRQAVWVQRQLKPFSLCFLREPAKTATCTWFPVQEDSYHGTSWSRVWVDWIDGDIKFLKKKLKQETHLGRVGSVSGKACSIYLIRWMKPMTLTTQEGVNFSHLAREAQRWQQVENDQ